MTPARDPLATMPLLLWTVAVLIVGTLVGIGVSGGLQVRRVEASPSSSNNGGESTTSFASVAETVLPAVVSVEALRWFQHPSVVRDSLGGEEGRSPFGPEEEIEIPSSGSGFIIDEKGYILTNEHVVRGAAGISVHLADGRQLPALLVGKDAETDLAVLKIETNTHLPTVPLGDSDALRIGEWVAAVGNPLGVLEGSLTVGVVSAKARNEIQISGSTPSYQDFIQTDASINFGNSGGPLVNIRGEAVGINTAFNGPGRGIGFAVSINMAKEVSRALIEKGRVERGYIGVTLQPLDASLAQGLGLPDVRGALVREVTPDTPADRAGVKAGDVVLEFDGVRVRDVPSFRLLVARTPVGRGVPMRLYRYGVYLSSNVELVERPNFQLAADEAAPARHETPTELGLELVSSGEGQELDSSASWVKVASVKPGSLASEAGLEEGDLILEVDGQPTPGPEVCLESIQRARDSRRPAVLRVSKHGDRLFLSIRARTVQDR